MGVTKSRVIREAIDGFLDAPADGNARLARFRVALDDIAREPLPLPDGRSYVEDVRAADAPRQRELEERRR
jgi:hypothetical protein